MAQKLAQYHYSHNNYTNLDIELDKTKYLFTRWNGRYPMSHSPAII